MVSDSEILLPLPLPLIAGIKATSPDFLISIYQVYKVPGFILTLFTGMHFGRAHRAEALGN